MLRALPGSSRKSTSAPFRGVWAPKGYIGHGLKPVGSGDAEGAGLGDGDAPCPRTRLAIVASV